MRLQKFLLLLTILALVASAFFAFVLFQGRLSVFTSEIKEVSRLIVDFRETQKPLVEVNLSALYGGSGQFQILHSTLSFTHNTQLRSEPFCRTFEVSLSQSVSAEQQQRRDKEYLWSKFLYEKKSLPDHFFSSPPYLDSAGTSYALLATHSGRKPHAEKRWIQEHLSLYRLSEVKELLSEYEIIDPVFSILVQIDNAAIEELVMGSAVVLTQNFLFIKNQSKYGFSPLSYWVYRSASLTDYLQTSNYTLLRKEPGLICITQEGNTCWTFSSKHTISFLFRYSMGILIFLFLTLIILLVFYFKRQSEKQQEQQRRKLSLQVLSHEFRTPVSTMLLVIDNLNKQFANYDSHSQEQLTRLSTEVYRLQRIIEISKTYLQADSRQINFKQIELPSINAWLGDLLEGIRKPVHFVPLSEDFSLVTDPFWLSFIITSLIDNAFVHGSEPVKVYLAKEGKYLKMSIQDSGQCEFNHLKEMTEPFTKSPKSKGMGLGLNIVNSIIQEWGSQLLFSSHPTTFTLILRGQLCKKF